MPTKREEEPADRQDGDVLSEATAKAEPQGDTRLGPTAPSGWYPKPETPSREWFWDGSNWTGASREVSAAQGQADLIDAPEEQGAQASPSGSSYSLSLLTDDPARMMIAGGGAALAISPFLTWVKIVLLGSLSLFQLADASNGSSSWAWAVVGGGAVAAVLAATERDPRALRWIGVGVSALGALVAYYGVVTLRDDVEGASGLATIGIGPYVSLGGCLALAAGIVMLWRRQRGAS